MIEEIYPDLFRIEIPLPENPLRALNSYIIRGNNRNLIIDTGFNRDICFRAMQNGLHKLMVDLRETDFFVTHRHSDHIGLVSRLATESSIIYFNRHDAESKIDWNGMLSYAGSNGFPGNLLTSAFRNHPGFKYKPKKIFDFNILCDGDKVEAGDYHFICLETPGHTRGHMCLYDASKKLFFSGDHILTDITPNIACFSKEGDPLCDYLASLEKVYKLDVNLVLPGHRRRIDDHIGRIEELKNHHQKRSDEVLNTLRKGSMNAYQIASRMTWDITCPVWEMFPVSQKWFATGEVIAHLRYLENRAMIYREADHDVIHFSRY